MRDIRSISHDIREKAQNLSGIEIISIAIFGSTVRHENHADSDIDLLVVAEGIAKKRIQRIPDIVNGIFLYNSFLVFSQSLMRSSFLDYDLLLEFF